MKLPDEIKDFLGGDQGRPWLGLGFVLFGLAMFALFEMSDGMRFYSSLR